MRTTLASLLFLSLTVACSPGEYTPGGGNPPPGDGPDADPGYNPDPPDPGAPDAGPPDAETGRATANLQAVWDFNEGLGAVIHDTSGVGTAMDLEVAQPGLTTWTPSGLRIDASTILRTNAPASKIIDACLASNEITIEAWVSPASNTTATQVRIAGVSLDTDNRDFSLFQSNADYQVALRTGTTTLDGDPVVAAPGAVLAQPQHIVYTRDTAGAVHLYIDAIDTVQDTRGDTFANWDPSFEFFIANEGTLDRPFLGTLHLVAVYSRALTPAEVTRNFAYGY